MKGWLRRLAVRGRTLGGRIALLFIALLALVMTTIMVVAGSGIGLFAHQAASRDLASNARVFERILSDREYQMAQAAGVVARDFGFREALATGDRATVASALVSLRERTQAQEVAVIELDGSLIPSAEGRQIDGAAIVASLYAGRDTGVVRLDGELAMAAAVPVELPDLVGWLVVFKPLGPREIAELARLSAVQVQGRVVERARLDPAHAGLALGQVGELGTADGAVLTQVSALQPMQAGIEPRLVLVYPLELAMQGFSKLQWLLALIGLGGAVAGAWLGLRIAQDISRPLGSLAQAVRQYGAGTVAKVPVAGASELRSLARSFNGMVNAVEERERQITHASLHDSLTELPNRRFFIEKLDRAIARQTADSRNLIAFIDVDDFKAINDTLGHPMGDALLRHVARVLQERFPDAMVARFGGDEFGLLLPGLEPDADCANVARSIDAALNNDVVIDGRQLAVSCSFGIAVGPQDGANSDDLLKCADLALYRAKNDGKGTFHFFEAALDKEASRRRHLEIDLRRAIRDGEFELYFQPLYSLTEERVKGFEALIRWPHPQRGMISPVDFIPIAEESGLIVQLGEWVLREACHHAATWPDTISVAVNISPRQLTGDGLQQCVVQALAATGLAPTRLELEITESVFIGSIERTLKLLHGLRSLGVRVALDDFGTGYSSLSYLRSFPFDKLKIDQSFVRALDDDASAHAIVRAITSLADALSMETLAEGVESKEHRETLRQAGCQMIQGYLISKPMDAAAASAFIASAPRREAAA